MKHLLILFLFLLGFVACDNQRSADREQPQDNSTTEAQDISSVKALIELSFQDIWSDLDTTRIEQYHTDDFLLLENGVVWNNDSVRDYLSRERKEMELRKYKRLNRFEYIRSVHNQHSVWVAYHNYGTWVIGSDTLGTVHWLESAVAVKEKDKWKLEQLHSTTVRD